MQKKERPKVLEGKTAEVSTGHGTLYVTVNWDNSDGAPFEVFAALGKAGSCEAAHLEALTRLATLCLRYSIDPGEVVRQLSGITCHPYALGGEAENRSPADAISQVLRGSYEEDNEKTPS